jgi:predicted small secreted protein
MMWPCSAQILKENEMKKFSLFMLVGLFLMTSLMGCNMWRGAGQDVSDTGHHMEHAGE